MALLAGCWGDDTQPYPFDADTGKQQFQDYCAACHGPDGEGTPDGPPLAGSPWVAGNEERLIRILLHGVAGKLEIGNETYDLMMPGFGVLDDEEIAGVLTYVRVRFGEPSAPVKPATVSRVRAAHEDRIEYWTVEELLRVR